jgi:hypothetical protein
VAAPLAQVTSDKVRIFIDAHFHLVQAAKAMMAGSSHKGDWTGQVKEVLHHRSSKDAELGKCVASFCDSATQAELVVNSEILTKLAKGPRLYFSRAKTQRTEA